MTFRKGDEWQDDGSEPGREEGFRLEAVEVSPKQPWYGRVLGSVLTNEECDPRERGERVDPKDPSARTDRWRT